MENQRSELIRRALMEDAPQSPEDNEQEDSLQFLWAVSYSDLLMVLMSFFIVYFSFDSGAEKNLLGEISVKFKKTGLFPSDTSQKSVPEIRPTTAPQLSSSILKEVQLKLKGTHYPEKDLNGNIALRIDLENDVFRPGSWSLDQKTAQEIQELLNTIKPHRNEITLTFIGHADQTPVKFRNADIINLNNMNLSSLRASTGASYAIEQGFDPKAVWIEAYAEHSRNTRSLSVRIKEKIGP